MITRAIEKCFEDGKRKNWYKVYWLFDVHGTMMVPDYGTSDVPMQFYPYAEEALQEISRREDICMILYTCSHRHQIKKYLEFFESRGIHFDYVNENPEVVTLQGDYGNYDAKFYFNVLFEDKAGFSGEDWELVKPCLQKYPVLPATTSLGSREDLKDILLSREEEKITAVYDAVREYEVDLGYGDVVEYVKEKSFKSVVDLIYEIIGGKQQEKTRKDIIDWLQKRMK